MQRSRLRERDIEIMRAYGWEIDDALERTNPKDRSGHYTYVIASYANRVKIGHSNTPKRRLSSLQSGSPIELRLDKTWKLPRPRAQLLERQLHTAFSWAYSHGEWFEARSHAVAAVGDLFVADRVEDALRLASIMKAIEESDARLERLRKAWYWASGRPKERRQAEIEAQRQIPDAERENARLWLEAFDLGYTGLVGERARDFERRRDNLRALAA